MKWLICLLLGTCSAVAEARTSQSLDAGWRFAKGDASGAERRDFDDSTWESLSVPHSWNASDAQISDYYRGVGWYRRALAIAPLEGGERVFLRFGAAAFSADVYLNGTWIGHHDGGFTAFTFDVTPYVQAGQPNLLAVKVSNAVNPDIAPVSADFTFFGGLYRDVELIRTPPVHVSLLDHGAAGLYGSLTTLTPGAASVAARTLVANDGGDPVTVEVVFRIEGKRGVVRARSKQAILIPPGATLPVAGTLTLPNPHLWNGRQDPYLYRLAVEVRGPAGILLLDRVTEPLGIRQFAVTPDGGLTLNGRHLELRGVNMHQDWQGKGWAVGDAERAENVADLLEMGANAVRLCHYPHHPRELDLLDQHGIVAWSEIPLVNVVTPTDAFTTSTKTQLVEMIRQLYNHPAIAFWGLFNEVKADPTGLVESLNQLAHAEDPSRLTTAATDRPLGFPLHPIPDLLAFNRYDGWYYGTLADFGAFMDSAHAYYPAKGLGVSEYGAGANTAQHTDVVPTDDRPEDFHPEERQSAYHETYIAQLAARPYLFGHFIWNLFDFASAGRHEGGQDGLNDKGLITYDRKIKKDAFYLYKASWTRTPTLYITSRRFTERTQASTSVKIYSNLDAVRVALNGKELGTPTSHAGVIWRWDGVRLAPGTNEVRAVGVGQGQTLSDAATWSLKPPAR